MTDFPHYPVSIDWWLATTAHLSLEERGAFMDMLALAWTMPACDLPNDPKWLCRRLRISLEKFEAICQPILDELWYLNKHKRWEQKREKNEHKYVRQKSSQNKRAAAKRWKKTKKTDANGVCDGNAPTPTPTPTLSSVEPNGSTGADAPLDVDAFFYREGRRILGKQSGALLTKLKRAKGSPEAALKVLEVAQRKSDPTAYVAAACQSPADVEAEIAEIVQREMYR